MKNLVLSSLALSACVGCPAPTIDTVDGLGGGTLTSAVTAPALTTTELTTDTLDVTGEVTAGAVTAQSVTTAGGVAGSSLVVQRGAARVAFFGLIVGATPRITGEAGGDADDTTPNYAVRQQACAAAFPATADGLPAAHVCTAQEAMAHALQAPDTVPQSVSGAIVHSYGHTTFAQPDGEGVERVVNDCGALFDRVGTTNSSLRLHRRASDGFWSLRIEDGCATDEPLVCCQ